MKTLGLIGGMSWESTALYYQWINEGVRDGLGPLRSASIVMQSYDFDVIKQLQYAGQWDEAGRQLADTARNLETIGAQAILICTNTMHKVADEVAATTSIPLIHIADCTADAIIASNIHSVALLGTQFTMEQDFYRGRLIAMGLAVTTPEGAERQDVHRIIYDELCRGIVTPASRATVIAIIERMAGAGADGIILGCTELTMLIGAHAITLPIFDTTAIHVEAAVRFALSDESGRQ